MKRILLLLLFAFMGQWGYPQSKAGYLIDYYPAPGQYINIEGIGVPQAAQKAVSEVNSIVSLGSFGGHIVLGFENPCVNDPENPYGIDFTIFGNSFSGSSEPGAVWVMKDENSNGQPDDTWYEIAGSNHFFSGTIRNYAVTYYKIGGRNIPWKDNRGESGVITGNTFNLQDYYPLHQYFPDYPRDSVTFKGTLIENYYYTSASSEIKVMAPVFGYADSRPKSNSADLSLPDNPYTQEIEGAGGDPVDISWAIDSLGKYVDLDKVHFVKIVTAGLDEAGWLGENSTELAWIEPVKARSGVSGKENILVVKPLPEKILLRDEIVPEAVYFKKGRKHDTQVLVESSDTQVAEMSANGVLELKKAGAVQLLFSAGNEKNTVSVKVAEPQKIEISNQFSGVYPGDTIELKADVYDNWNERLELFPEFSTSGGTAGKVIYYDGKYYFVALQPGELTLTAALAGYQLQVQDEVKVLSPDIKIRVLISMKSASENLLPLQWVETGITDVNKFVDARKRDYNDTTRLTVAHALTTGLKKLNDSFKFRDDVAAEGKLYLYQVFYDGLYSYGWGGKTNSSINLSAWIANLNGVHYLNDFDSVPIADGDTLVLYHVPNILESWDYTRLLATSGGDRFTEFLLEKAICRLQNGIVTQSNFTPVADAIVATDEQYFTDAAGKVMVEHDVLPVVVKSGIDAVLLSEDLSTGVEIPALTFSVYPNPVVGNLYINYAAEGIHAKNKMYIKLFDAYGGLLIEEEFYTIPSHLDLAFLPPGLYHLVMSDGKRSQIKKVIKK